MTCEITSKTILASVGRDAPPIATLQLRYPLQIHAELMTHREFSRNARSSRAVPTARMIEEVRNAPFIPRYWGANQKGMQANEECDAAIHWLDALDEPAELSPEEAWLRARDNAVTAAQAFMEAGYHKQVCNRLLAPFLHIDTLVTSTSFSNWNALRDDKAAEPHIRDLAQAMRESLRDATVVQLGDGQWHTPFVTAQDWDEAMRRADQRRGLRPEGLSIGEWIEHTAGFRREARAELVKISVPRCAAISYKPFHKVDRPFETEILKHDDLSGHGHWSPFEHQAMPDYQVNGAWARPELHGNLNGWVQYRKTFPGEYR